MDFRVTTEVINQSQEVQAGGKCNAMEFVNTGDEALTIDGRPLPVKGSGDAFYPSVCYYGLLGETMKGKFTVIFAGGGAAPGCHVIRKIYE